MINIQRFQLTLRQCNELDYFLIEVWSVIFDVQVPPSRESSQMISPPFLGRSI